MDYKNNEGRRNFLRLLGIGGAVTAMTFIGEETHGDVPKKQFKGVSKSGNIEEALQEAIAAAERSVRHPDAMVNWTLKSISGRSGGIAGFKEVTVTIEAKVS
jgi:Flp pilus assembly protein TadB